MINIYISKKNFFVLFFDNDFKIIHIGGNFFEILCKMVSAADAVRVYDFDLDSIQHARQCRRGASRLYRG